MRASFVRTLCTTAATAVALAACSRTVTHTGTVVTITPDRAAYTAGSVATLTVRNVAGGPVDYNLCEHLIERGVPGGWTVVEHFPPSGAACTDNLLSLPAGEAVTVRVQLAAELPEGTYRVEFPGIAGNFDVVGSIDRASDPFRVRRPALVPVD